MKVESVAISALQKDPDNARKHSQRNLDAIAKSLESFGQRKPIVVWQGFVIAGNGTLEAAQQLGWSDIAIARVPDDWSHEQARAYALADNRSAELAEWDTYKLNNQLIDLDAVGYEIADWGFDPIGQPFDPLAQDEVLPDQDKETQKNVGVLAERFGVPPFSVIDQRSGAWQARKKLWLSLGIESEIGRDSDMAFGSQAKMDALLNSKNYPIDDPDAPQRFKSGTSIFDPVLTELSVAWFAPQQGLVLDPFAGGSVRGLVTAITGRDYIGLELRQEQVEANQAQALDILPKANAKGVAKWQTGDSNVLLDSLDVQVDMVFSCPPYVDLEQYSDDAADISNMTYPDFLTIYNSIIKKSVDKLKDDRFAVWVVGEVRDKRGDYYGFVPDTVKAFEAAGMQYYNELIMVAPVGSLCIRAERFFVQSRKIGKTHQNVLVFLKGDARRATEACGQVWVQPVELG